MQVSGFCPTQKKDYAIDVSYIYSSTMEETQYTKGTFRCEYDLFGDKCNGNNCPIYKTAPEHIR